MDAVPRAAARAEDHGTLRLFVKTVAEGWPYYARPIPGAGPCTSEDVERVRARQRELGLPEALEWIEETAGGLTDAARLAGLEVVLHPLMALSPGELRSVEPPEGATVRMARADDDHAHLAGVAMAGFEVPGTDIADRSFDDVERLEATVTSETVDYKRRRLENGVTLPAFAELDGRIVAVGYHQPVGTMSEIVGVATLAAFRRRGLGAALTSLLASDAFERGADTAVLSAGDDAVARVYERVGFRRVGTMGNAGPPRRGRRGAVP